MVVDEGTSLLFLSILLALLIYLSILNYILTDKPGDIQKLNELEGDNKMAVTGGGINQPLSPKDRKSTSDKPKQIKAREKKSKPKKSKLKGKTKTRLNAINASKQDVLASTKESGHNQYSLNTSKDENVPHRREKLKW